LSIGVRQLNITLTPVVRKASTPNITWFIGKKTAGVAAQKLKELKSAADPLIFVPNAKNNK